MERRKDMAVTERTGYRVTVYLFTPLSISRVNR